MEWAKRECRESGLVGGGAGALGNYFTGVFVKGAGLGNGLDGLLDLGIGFEKNFEAFLGAVGGHEYFLLDLAFDPVEVVGVFGFGVVNVMLRKIGAEILKHFVVDFKRVRDGGLGAEVVAGESGNALFSREEDIAAEHILLELVELGRDYNDVGRDAAATGNLAAAVGLANFGWMIGNLALVVILVKRDGFVVALDEPAAGCVVASGCQERGRCSRREAGRSVPDLCRTWFRQR